jgi:hypothetical protein
MLKYNTKARLPAVAYMNLQAIRLVSTVVMFFLNSKSNKLQNLYSNREFTLSGLHAMWSSVVNTEGTDRASFLKHFLQILQNNQFSYARFLQ